MVAKITLFSDPQLLPNANVIWHQEAPVAADFDDFYGSTDDAIGEKTHVFLQPNKLPERMAAMAAGEHLSILELGFGGGLNFLLSWQLWRRQRAQTKQSARLIYTSIEAFPMTLEDLQRWQQQWPELAELAAQLQVQYPLPIKGFHQLQFADVVLNLVFGPVTEALQQVQGRVDAVYLDGFNPAKNQAMWGLDVMQHIARLSHAQTTIATYSAARLVKDNLTQAGFAVATASGYGLKRNQLSGHFCPAKAVADNKQVYHVPWLRPLQPLPKGGRIAVVGAGISGCSTALALQQRGYQVQLIEQAEQVAQGASGNQQGMLYAKLPDSVTIAGQLHQQGLQHSMRCLANSLEPAYWQASGLIQVAQSEAELAQMQRVSARQFPAQWLTFVGSGQASQQAEQRLAQAGLLFSQAGWASPPRWCEALADQLQLAPWFNTCLTRLARGDNNWHLHLQGEQAGVKAFDGVVLCSAHEAKRWLPALALPLKSIRGQVTYVDGQGAPAKVVCGDGYVTPAKDGSMAVGASYNLASSDPELTAEDHLANLQRLQKLLPESRLTTQHIRGGRVGFRATTPDYLPMVGQLADADAMLVDFAHLRKDKNYRFANPMPWLPGLYINAGHGSKGLISAPLAAELVAAQISGEPLPVSQHVAAALEPNRFFLRDMMRRKR